MTIIAVGMTLIAVFFGGVYIPLTTKLSDARQEHRQYTVEAAQLSADVTRLPVLSDQLDSMRAKVGDFSARVPRTRQLGEFLQTVAKIMNELDLQKQFLQPGDAIKARGIRCIPVDIKCEGSLRQVFGLLRSMENVERSIRFETVELTTDRSFSGSVSLHSKVYIYYKDDSEAEI